MSKGLKKIASIAAPVVGNFLAPGIGGVLGGALGGGLSGGGLKGVLGGGLGGAALGGFGSGLGGALGATGVTANALGTGILGAGAGALTGGTKGALLGGALGGLAGGLGNASGTALDKVSGVAGAQGPTQGNGIFGKLSSFGSAGNSLANGLSSAKNSLTGGGVFGGGGSSYSPLTSIASGLIGTNTNDDAAKALQKQQKQALGLFQPYLNAKFEPGDLTQDPGYQFQLKQGQQALDRTQSARGNYLSGEALKSAQDYGQGLASQTYNEAYQRYLQQNAQNLNAAGSAAGIYDNIGNIQGNQIVNNGNVLSQSLAGVLGGQASNNTGALTGGNSINGLLQGLTPEQIASLKLRNPSLFAGA